MRLRHLLCLAPMIAVTCTDRVPTTPARVHEVNALETSPDAVAMTNSTGPDLEVGASVDDSKAETGGSFTLSATVTNSGDAASVRVSVSDALTASFANLPATHDGETEFAFHVRFSEDIRNSIAGMRDRAFKVTGGSVVRARRVNGDKKYWEITIQPDGDDDVVIVLEPNRGCGSGPCTTDRRRLSKRLEETVNGPALPEASITANSATVAEGTSASFTVTLGEAPTEAVTVAVSVAETDAMLAGTAPTSVEIVAGATSAVLAVATDDDKVVEDNSTVTATLSLGTGYTVGADDSDEVVVTDNDEATFTVAAELETITEGESTTLTVAITNEVTFAEDQTISLSPSGTAVAADYTLSPTTRTLTAGQSSVTATLTATDDTEMEDAETVVVTASHDGASVGSATVTIAASGALSDDATLKTLTAEFEDMPATHDGLTEFAFHVRFSEDIRNPIASMRDRAFDVTGGSVVNARRVNGDKKYWKITIQPDGDDEVVIVLAANQGCGSGPCTKDRRRLAKRLEETVKGPLTAEFANLPATHDGQTAFTFEVHFSVEPSGLSYVTVRDALFDVTNGNITNTGRVTQGSNLAFRVTVKPSAASDISLTVRGTTDCEADHAVCTADGHKLAGGTSATVEFNLAPEVTNALEDIAATPAERYSAYLPDVFTDPNGDDLTWTTSSGDTGMARAEISGDSIIVNAVAEGTVTVSVTATDPGGQSATDEFEVTVAAADFNMELHFTIRVSEEQAAEIRKARDRWEKILADTELADVTFDDELWCTEMFTESPGVVDDLLVIVDVTPIDGSPGYFNTLAYAEPSCYARDSDGTPIVSGVLFDSSDIDEVLQSGLLEDLAFHEFGHALGFVGDFFEDKGLLGKGSDPHFKGALTIEAFDAAGGEDYDGAKVPLSIRFWHWRESVLTGEIMTVTLETGTTVSAITLQAMADLGYKVDLSQADDYELPGASASSALGLDRGTPGEVYDLSNDVVMGPVRMVDTNGRVVHILSPSDRVGRPFLPRRISRTDPGEHRIPGTWVRSPVR